MKSTKNRQLYQTSRIQEAFLAIYDIKHHFIWVAIAVLMLVSTGCPPPSFPPPSSLPSYAELKKKPDGGYTKTTNNSLYIHYKDEYSSTALKYKVFDKQNQMVTSDLARPVSLIPGWTQYILDMNGVVNGTDFFMLEVTNSQDEKWYLRFK